MKHEITAPVCLGKQSHPNRGEAIAVLERMRTRARRRGKKGHMKHFCGTRMVPYQCRFCGHWHIGNQP
jgi:hypothetical protein